MREEHFGIAVVTRASALEAMTPEPLVPSEVESVETAITRLRERH